MGELTELPNIGPTLEQQLNDIGIKTYEELKNIGAEEAWLRIQVMDPSACINRLLALEGAIQNVRKSDLPILRKNQLKEFCRNHKI